ncbi:HNH endonuclease family protein [Xanthomonas phage OP1]|uniref:HNH endonuclease family protein n=1 Tax=Xanthomonas phage OP1 TaxID=2994040 RepID=Q2NPI8_9CAUD|nr:HNH endonuclease family protein [Xanthomonas phage OP1]BAE72708.1 HNH endonuclease family protein [Xanthomonas phage OP1]
MGIIMIDFTCLTFETLAELYNYDHETGMLTSKVDGTAEYLGIFETLEQKASKAYYHQFQTFEIAT